MIGNKYTEAMKSITAPEINLSELKPRPKNKRLKFIGMTAACLAVIIAAGTVFSIIPRHKGTAGDSGYTYSGNKNGNRFSLSVGAASATDGLEMTNDYNGGWFDSGDSSGQLTETEYGYRYISNSCIRLNYTGDNIENITLSMDKGAVCVSYFNFEGSPVLSGTEKNIRNELLGKIELMPPKKKLDEIAATDDKDERNKRTKELLNKLKDTKTDCYSTVTFTPEQLSKSTIAITQYLNSEDLPSEKREYYEGLYKEYKDSLLILDDHYDYENKIAEYQVTKNKKMLDQEREARYNETAKLADFINKFSDESKLYCKIRFRDGTEETLTIQAFSKAVYFKDMLVRNGKDESEAENHLLGNVPVLDIEYHITEIN